MPPPDGIECVIVMFPNVTAEEKASLGELTIIGLDLAKRVFQVHGACSNGSTLLRKKLSGAPLLPFLARQPRCIVAMEACASAHFWGQAIQELGHEVRLILRGQFSEGCARPNRNSVRDDPGIRIVGVNAVLVRADRYIFGTGEANTLTPAYIEQSGLRNMMPEGSVQGEA